MTTLFTYEAIILTNRGTYTSGLVHANSLTEAWEKAEKNFGATYGCSIEDVIQVFGPENYNLIDYNNQIEELEEENGVYVDTIFGTMFHDHSSKIQYAKTRWYMGMRFQYGGF